MKKITDYLQQLDLSESEAQIYLSLLKTGPISVRELARTIGIKRTSAYMYIDRLLEKGLIMKLVIKSHTQVAANNPKDTLKYLVEQKVQNDITMQQDLPGIINTINASITQSSPNEDAEIKYYRGKQGVKKIYEEVVKAKEVRSYLNIEEIEDLFPENFELFDEALKKNPGIKIFEIVQNTKKAQEKLKSSSKIKSYFRKRNRFAYKILPDDVKISSTDIMIYDGNVSIINLKESITGVVLRNADLYNNFRQLFDFIWKVLPEK